MKMDRNRLESILAEFAVEFFRHPYICYNEHGLHAWLFCKVYQSLSLSERAGILGDQYVSIVQSEYPTAHDLDKSRRQNWDISILKQPLEPLEDKPSKYDYLKLDAVIEMGLNAPESHLLEDVRRMVHKKANVSLKYILHFYRLSDGYSGRDLKPNHKGIMSKEEAQMAIQKTDVVVYYVMFDSTGKLENGVWEIRDTGIRKLG